MRNDDEQDLPKVEPEAPAPLRVIPVSKNIKVEFAKNVVTNTLILLTVYGLIYGIVYAVSAGWHDGGCR